MSAQSLSLYASNPLPFLYMYLSHIILRKNYNGVLLYWYYDLYKMYITISTINL